MAFVGLSLGAFTSTAATLAQYSFTGGSLVATSFDSTNFTSASDVSRGAGFNAPATFTTDWVYAQGNQTLAADPASNATTYFTFTLTPKAGVTYNLTSLTFDAAFYEITGISNGGTTNYVIRSDVLGYATDIASITEAGQTTTTPTFHGKTVDLSGASYQGIGATATFRIYVWDSITAGSRVSAIDNLTLNGTITPVPEPSSYSVMAGVAAVAFAGLRRRRQRSPA